MFRDSAFSLYVSIHVQCTVVQDACGHGVVVFLLQVTSNVQRSTRIYGYRRSRSLLDGLRSQYNYILHLAEREGIESTVSHVSFHSHVVLVAAADFHAGNLTVFQFVIHSLRDVDICLQVGYDIDSVISFGMPVNQVCQIVIGINFHVFRLVESGVIERYFHLVTCTNFSQCQVGCYVCRHAAFVVGCVLVVQFNVFDDTLVGVDVQEELATSISHTVTITISHICQFRDPSLREHHGNHIDGLTLCDGVILRNGNFHGFQSSLLCIQDVLHGSDAVIFFPVRVVPTSGCRVVHVILHRVGHVLCHVKVFVILLTRQIRSILQAARCNLTSCRI